MSAAKNNKKGKATPKTKTPATLPFLVEIGTEELPPKSLRKLALAFLEHFEAQALAKGMLPAGTRNEVFFSPRRLAIYAPALYPQQPDRSEEKLGPAVAAAYDAAGNPTKAAEGFAKSCNTTVDKLARKQSDKGERLAFTLEIKGETAATLLPGMVQEALAKLPIGKRMRWGAGTAEFVRPVHWVLMLLGDKVLKNSLLDVAAGNKTYGHRFHHPAAITVKQPSEYRKLLEKTGKVRVEDRDGTLADEIGKLVSATAAKMKGKARLEQALLEEVAALVEWPVPLVGDFDPKFLALPDEVIEVVLQGQQRYFPLRDAHGKLLPHFVTISNVQSKDPKEVKRGNERVIVPRLTDAMFFWDLDKGTSLEARIEELNQVVFQKELGSYGEKSRRVAKLAEIISKTIGGDASHARRAATLAKCDLLTNLVGEFPELQGSIGRYVATETGEAADVARAMEEQYLPRFSGDRLPETKTGQSLAIADKLDTVCGIFAVGQKPTGEKDPFAVRRQTLGILRIVIEKNLQLNITKLIGNQVQTLEEEGRIAYWTKVTTLDKEGKAKFDKAAQEDTSGAIDSARIGLIREIDQFFTERLRALALEAGMRTDVVNAVLANANPSHLEAWNKIREIQIFLQRDDARRLIVLFKRCDNILQQAQSLGYSIPAYIDPESLETREEKVLNEAIEAVRDKVLSQVHATHAYREALSTILSLEKPLAEFFDSVMVMTNDTRLRDARLGLILGVYTPMKNIADFSLVQADI